MGRYEESLSAFRRAEVLAGKLRGRDSGAYATVLNNMAGTCRLLHRASEAESLFLRAMECYRQAGLEDSDAYTSVLNNLSLVYRETGELGKAIDYLLQALKRLEERGDRRAELLFGCRDLQCGHSVFEQHEHPTSSRCRTIRTIQRTLNPRTRMPIPITAIFCQSVIL